MTEQLKFLARRRAAAAGVMSHARDDEGVALLTAILFMILVAGLSVVLVSTVIGLLAPGQLAQKNTRTIYSAQAGLQTSLAILRSAAAAPDVAGKVYGDATKLPCTLTGQPDAQNDGLTYSVALTYFSQDPTGQSTAWISANKLSCSAAGVTPVPSYVLIVSQGLGTTALGVTVATAGNRTLSAIYKFKVSTINTKGGRIYDYGAQYCMEAVTATAGSYVKFVAAAQCTNDALELWTYDTDYEIKLASTTLNGAAGLCITGPVNPGDANGNAVLQPCLATTDANRWNQLWSWVGSNSWQGQNKTISAGPSGYCLATGYATGTALTGKYVQISNGCNGGFAPSAQVGAGAARYETHQMVNYKEFGRCADVTGEQIGADHMISYPCKQDPTGSGVNLLWNHKWYYTEPVLPATKSAKQQIYVYYQDKIAQKYCLTTAANGGFVTFTTCTNAANQDWVRAYDVGTYVNSYLFTDTNGNCLTADSTKLDGNWSKLTVATCNGSDAQKWNAPATYTESNVGGYKEVSAG